MFGSNPLRRGLQLQLREGRHTRSRILGACTRKFYDLQQANASWVVAPSPKPCGLSCTSFAYSDLQTLPGNDGGLDFRVEVRNTGSGAGDEVVQEYLDMPARKLVNLQFAKSMRAGFERVSFNADESKPVAIHAPLRQFQFWSTEKHAWVTPEDSRFLWTRGSWREGRLQVKTNPQLCGASISQKETRQSKE